MDKCKTKMEMMMNQKKKRKTKEKRRARIIKCLGLGTIGKDREIARNCQVMAPTPSRMSLCTVFLRRKLDVRKTCA